MKRCHYSRSESGSFGQRENDRANLSTHHQPGNEGTWLKENLAYFQGQAEANDDDDNNIREMSKEIQDREDLRQLVE